VKTFIFGLVVGIACVIAAVFAYFLSGSAPVATASQPIPFEKTLANGALHARIEREAPKMAPLAADEANLVAGAQIYHDDCAICHGTPGAGQTEIAMGMFPKPPQLFRGKGVTDDPPGETYWKVAHGIRLTGMPSFSDTLTDTQMWQVSLALANADKLSDAAKRALQSPQPAASPAPAEPNVHGK